MSPDSAAALQPFVRQLAEMLVNEVRDIVAGSARVPSDTMLPADVARELKVSPKKVYGWIESKQLIAVNLNPGSKRPRYSIAREDFENFRKNLKPTPRPQSRGRRPVRSSTRRY